LFFHLKKKERREDIAFIIFLSLSKSLIKYNNILLPSHVHNRVNQTNFNSMKQILFYGLLVATLFTACKTGGDEAYQDALTKIAQLEDERLDLEEDRELFKEEYNQVIETLNEIDETLAGISMRENQMENLIGDLRGSDLQKEIILAKIESLKGENIGDQDKAKDLQKSLNAIKTDNSSLKKIILQYEEKIKAKDAEIVNYTVKMKQIESQLQYTESELNRQYAVVAEQKEALEVKNEKLEVVNQELEKKYEELELKEEFIADCVKGYYIAGSKRTLKDYGVLKRRVKLVLQSNYQQKLDKEKPFNFYKKTEIEVKRDIIKILPERPSNTYEIRGNMLFIKDIEDFWRTKNIVIVHK